MNEADQHFQTDLSVGEILRRTRLHYNQSLPDIERALRIRASQLEALETGNYEKLPGRVYVIGFIRSYSEYLGLNGEKMVHLFKTQAGGRAVPPAQMNFPVMASDTKMPQFWQVGLSVIAVLIILAVWWTMQSQDRALVTEVPPVASILPEEQQAQPPAQPAEEMPPQPATVQNTAEAKVNPVSAEIAAAAAEIAKTPEAEDSVAAQAPVEPATVPAAEAEKGVILNIKTNSWVEIRGKEGKSIVSRVLKAGDRYFVPDRPDLTISLGNSGGVELEVDGKKLKPLGAEGEVKRNIPLNAAYLRKNYGK